jgi:hypothetical protein
MKRPFGVTIIGILLLLQGLALLASVAFALWVQLTHDGSELQSTLAVNLGGFTLNQWLSATVMGALGLFSAAAGIGVLRLLPWAWFGAMALQGWTLATLLLNYFVRGGGGYLSMLLGVIIVFYLNTRSVRDTFDLAQRRAQPEEGMLPLAASPTGAPATAAEVTTPSRRQDAFDTEATG